MASDEVLKILTYKAEKTCAYITSIFPLSLILHFLIPVGILLCSF